MAINGSLTAMFCQCLSSSSESMIDLRADQKLECWGQVSGKADRVD